MCCFFSQLEHTWYTVGSTAAITFLCTKKEKKLWPTRYVDILCVESGNSIKPLFRLIKTRFNLTLVEPAFRLLISLVISLLAPVQPPRMPPIAHALQYSVQSDGECIERPRLPLCQAVRAEDLWLAYFFLYQSNAPTHRTWWGLGQLTSLQPSRGSRVGGLNQ